jgi:hypothetical protein
MRGVSKVVARGLCVVSIVMALAVSAEARPREDGRWFERRTDPIVKVLKKLFGIKSQGDGLSDPRPKP